LQLQDESLRHPSSPSSSCYDYYHHHLLLHHHHCYHRYCCCTRLELQLLTAREQQSLAFVHLRQPRRRAHSRLEAVRVRVRVRVG